MHCAIPIPDSIQEVKGTHGTMLIRRWKWNVIQFAGLALFCFFWDSIVGLVWWGALVGNVGWYVKVFMLPHAAVGIYLPWYLLAMLLNRTEIVVTPAELTIRRLPVPWERKRRVAVHYIAQLFAWEKNSGGKGASSSFELHMIDRDNQRWRMLDDLQTPEEALYLEQRLKELLALRHEPVAGRE
ncbi:MAG: hypothetical protein JWM59_4365 [Verrucomicrobiales bacterium]|nr:hypothetical protein [Verrucomicrobiales bacterium]